MAHLRKVANGHLGKAASGHLGGSGFPPAQATISWTGYWTLSSTNYFTSPTTLIADTEEIGAIYSPPKTSDYVVFNKDFDMQGAVTGYYTISFIKGGATPMSRTFLGTYKRLVADGMDGSYIAHSTGFGVTDNISSVSVTVP